jgi:hypothetical protein
MLQVARFITFPTPGPLQLPLKETACVRVIGTYCGGSCEKKQRSEDLLCLWLSPVVFQIPPYLSCGLFSESGSRFGTQSATVTHNSRCCLRHELHARDRKSTFVAGRRQSHEIPVCFALELRNTRVFGLERDKVTGEWRRLHSEELRDL